MPSQTARATAKCQDCPVTIFTRGNRKRCDDCQQAVEKTRRRLKEARYRERLKASQTPTEVTSCDT